MDIWNFFLCFMLNFGETNIEKKFFFTWSHIFPHDITTIKSVNSTWKCSLDLALEWAWTRGDSANRSVLNIYLSSTQSLLPEGHQAKSLHSSHAWRLKCLTWHTMMPLLLLLLSPFLRWAASLPQLFSSLMCECNPSRVTQTEDVHTSAPCSAKTVPCRA